MAKIYLNGQEHEISASSTLKYFLQTLALPTLEHGIAVCVNDEIINNSEWDHIVLQEGDNIEVIQATQGG